MVCVGLSTGIRIASPIETCNFLDNPEELLSNAFKKAELKQAGEPVFRGEF